LLPVPQHGGSAGRRARPTGDEGVKGSEALVQTLADSRVRACFANPGTSEMHTVYALDAVPELRGVLCLDEGVATGAADGYARMAGGPAATLLHLGPGLANGWANLHNARRARSPVVNVVGDHATYHRRYDAPLESDVDALAGAVSQWVRRPSRAGDVGIDAAEAVAAALGPPAGVATLILPANVAWDDGARPAGPIPPRPSCPVAAELIEQAAKTLRCGPAVVLLLGGAALREPALRAASRIAEGTGARLLTETHLARCQRGAGRPAVPPLAYFSELAEPQLAGADFLITAGARAPVAFFAYPGRPSSLVPPGCEVLSLGEPGQDIGAALGELAERVAPGVPPRLQPPTERRDDGDPGRPLDAGSVGALVAAALPAGAVVVEESITARTSLASATAGAPPHDWLSLVGGAIGEGLPLATGAAVAAPDRQVLCLEADGSAMYTITALWTQARHDLDVTTLILNNRSYAILQIEMNRIVSGRPGPQAFSMLDLSRPELDFVALAAGMGVEGMRASTAGELARALSRALSEHGPFLIDARLAA
jgi:acetolactate synthase-1/2/3 large subunit